MSQDIVYRSLENSVETELDGEIAVMNIETGELFVLKETGLAIWRRMDGVTDQATIVAEMCAEYDVDPETCRAQVDSFCNSLTQAGLAVVA